MSTRQKGQTAHPQTRKIFLLFKNSEPGIYRLGIFLAPAATEQLRALLGLSFKQVVSGTKSLPELAQIGLARTGALGTPDSGTWVGAAWPKAT